MFYPNLVRWITKHNPTENELQQRISSTFRAFSPEEKLKIFNFYKSLLVTKIGE